MSKEELAELFNLLTDQGSVLIQQVADGWFIQGISDLVFGVAVLAVGIAIGVWGRKQLGILHGTSIPVRYVSYGIALALILGAVSCLNAVPSKLFAPEGTAIYKLIKK